MKTKLKTFLSTLLATAFVSCSPQPVLAEVIQPKVIVDCIGSYSSNCLVTVDITLDNEAVYIEAKDNFSRHWCYNWNQDTECYLTGTYRIINGELSLQELVDFSAVLKTKKVRMMCYSFLGNAPVCQPRNN